MGVIFFVFCFAATSFACQNGCTPGFWKNHTELFPAQVFTTAKMNVPGLTLTFEEALNAKGGGMAALSRHTAAALLNEMTWGCYNEDFAPDGIANFVGKATLSQLEAIKDELDAQNNGYCFGD